MFLYQNLCYEACLHSSSFQCCSFASSHYRLITLRVTRSEHSWTAPDEAAFSWLSVSHNTEVPTLMNGTMLCCNGG
jgi:hypothetical protein